MTAEKITVCIPAYNRAHFLRQALYSLLDQGLSRGELVVAISDDASPDNTPEVVSEFQDKLQIVYQRNQTNVGHIRNYEIAAGLCRTPYISFLPDDDLVAPGQLGRALAALKARPEVVLVSSLQLIQEYPGAPGSGYPGMFLRATTETSYSEPYAWTLTEWMALSLVRTPTSWVGAVFQKDIFERCNLWKSYPMWHDRLMLAEMGLHGGVITLPWVGGYYRMHGQQLHPTLAESSAGEFHQISLLILDICKSQNIPVMDFWVEQICAATPANRIIYLRMLHTALPTANYEKLRRECESRLKQKLNLGFRLDQMGVPRPVAEFLRVIDRRLRKAT